MTSPIPAPPAWKPRDAAGRPPKPKDRSMLAVAPMMPAALGIAAGVLADRFGPTGWGTWAWGVLAAAGVVMAMVECWAGWRTLVGIPVAFFGIGGAWHHASWSDLAADDLARGVAAGSEPRPAWLRGAVVETPIHRPDPERPGGQGRTRTVVAVTGACDGRDWRRASGRVAVWIGGDRSDLEPGRPVELAGSLGPIEGPLNPGERDARDSWRAEGVRLRLVIDSPSGVWADPAGAAWPWTDRLGRARAWSHRRLVEGLDPAVAPLASALLLGRREGVDPDLTDAFNVTGTTHLLAISGLHLQALAMMLWLAFRLAGVGRRKATWAVMLASTAYAVLVGLAPSVARSLAMTLAACIVALIDRRPRPANMLAIAAVVTLWLNPAHLFDAGCQLSFLAVAAILWAVPSTLGRLRPDLDRLDQVERDHQPGWRKGLRRAGGWVVEGAVVSVVVWVAAWPFVASRFHLTAPVGILINLPLVPITSGAMLAAGLSLGLAAIWAPLGLPAAWACRGLLGVTDAVVRWGARQSWGHWFGPGPPEGWVLAFYAALGLAAAAILNGWGVRARRSACAMVAACSAAMVLGAWLPTGTGRPEAEVLAVGHGLAVAVRSGDGRTLLYDAGRMGDPRVGRRLIAPALWARGVSRLDSVVLSHADSDHYNGLGDLLDRFAIGEVVVAPGFVGESNPGAKALLDRVRGRGVPVRTVAKGDRWALGRDVRLTVLHPPAAVGRGAKDNERSVVLEVESGGRRLLLTGDLEGPGLAALIGREAPSIDAFLAPHHGGRASNPPWLYDWARPGLVVSSQRRPAPGSRDALTEVERRSVPVLRTDRRGAVRLRWTETGLAADGFLDGARGLDPGVRPAILAAGFAPAFRPTPTAVGVAVGVGGLVVGLLAVSVMAVVEFGAWILVTPGRPLALPADDPYPGEPIQTSASDGARLVGTWHGHPEADGRTLLLLHGLAEGRQMMRARADGIFARGWNVAVLDARAYGDSGGGLASFGGREVADLGLWVDAVARKVGPGLRLAVWGRSMGAAVALRAAADAPRVRALVLEAPYIDLHRTAATLIRRYGLPGSRPLAALVLRRAGRLAGVSLHRPRPIDVAPRVAVPALILRGTGDALVSESETSALAAALGGPVETVAVPSARHSKIVDVGGPALIDRVGEFLDRAVGVSSV